jgi:hypothetical protein
MKPDNQENPKYESKGVSTWFILAVCLSLSLRACQRAHFEQEKKRQEFMRSIR